MRSVAKVKPLKLEVKVSDKVAVKTSNLYLVIKNKERCRIILLKEEIGENDIIDFLISLHLVLEVSLNAMFRVLTTIKLKKPVDEIEVIENIDKVSFINKAALFIYNSNFDFKNLEEAANHHKVIGRLRNFAEARNKLIHGHAINTITEHGEQTRSSRARELVTSDNLHKQIELFKNICDDLSFFITHLVEDSFSDKFIEDIKSQYLDYEFLIEEEG